MVKKEGVDIAGMSTLTKKDHCHVLARSSEREEGGVTTLQPRRALY